jgi:nucleoid-associated protein YgaU
LATKSPPILSGATATAGIPQAGVPHPTPAGEENDMQNLFPNEKAPKHNTPTQNPQDVAMRTASAEPMGVARSAEALTSSAPNPSTQRLPARTPPSQNEPLDNDLDEPHPTPHSASDNRGLARLRQDAQVAVPGGAPAGAPIAGRAEALLASKDQTPIGEDAAFDKSQQSANEARLQSEARPIPPRQTFGANTSGATNVPRDARLSTRSDDPFASNRPSGDGGHADRGPIASQRPLGQSTRSVGSPGTVFPVGTTSDSGDYYVVQPQDNFWTISRKKYGTSRYFHALAELNKSRIPDPGRMRPGMKVSTPPAEMLEERYGQFMPPGTKVQVTAAEDTSAKSPPTGFIVSSDGTPKYRTGEHDTLSNIAARHLGRSSRWIQIYEMNRDKLSSPNQLKVGTELILPSDASNLGLSSEDDERR